MDLVLLALLEVLDDVAPFLERDRVGGAEEEDVGALAAGLDVLVPAAIEHVLAGTALQYVAAFASDQPVGAAPADKLVVAEPGMQRVLAALTLEDVVQPRAHHEVHALRPDDRQDVRLLVELQLELFSAGIEVDPRR